jgi:hypothetical protein
MAATIFTNRGALGTAGQTGPSPLQLCTAYYPFVTASGFAYVYFEDEPGRRAAAKLVTRDEAPRIAAEHSCAPSINVNHKVQPCAVSPNNFPHQPCGFALRNAPICRRISGGDSVTLARPRSAPGRRRRRSGRNARYRHG